MGLSLLTPDILQQAISTLTPEQLAQLGLRRPATDQEAAAYDQAHAQPGAPADFAGPVFPNPEGLKVSDDTESGIEPTRLPAGVTLQRQNFTGKMPTDISSPAAAQLATPGMHEIQAKFDPAQSYTKDAAAAPSAFDPNASYEAAPAEETKTDEKKEPPNFWDDPKGFLEHRAAELRGESQHQTNLAMGPESEGKGYFSRLGHRMLSLAPETAAVVDEMVAGGMDWKNAIAIAAGAVDPALPAAYFGAHGAAQLTGIEPGINAGDTSPENVQRALLAGAAVTGAAGAGSAPNAGSTVDFIKKQANRTAPIRLAARTAETAINQKLVPVKKLANLMTPADEAEALTVKVPGRDYGLEKPKPAAKPAEPFYPGGEAEEFEGITSPQTEQAASIDENAPTKASSDPEDLEGVTSPQTEHAAATDEEPAPGEAPEAKAEMPAELLNKPGTPAELEKRLTQALGGQPLQRGVSLRNQVPGKAAAPVAGLPEGFTPVENSSVLKGYKYTPETKEFDTITNDGRHYIHGEVSPEQAQAFADAKSKGTAWSKEIRANNPLVAKVLNGKRVSVQTAEMAGNKGNLIAKSKAGLETPLEQKAANLQDFIKTKPDEALATPPKKVPGTRAAKAAPAATAAEANPASDALRAKIETHLGEMAKIAAVDNEFGENPFRNCTQCAHEINKRLGEGEVWGYAHGENPTAKIGETEGGHDFSVIRDRYLVDHWAKDYYDKPWIYDLKDPQDLAAVRKEYGDPKAWQRYDEAQEKFVSDKPPLPAKTAAAKKTAPAAEAAPAGDLTDQLLASLNQAKKGGVFTSAAPADLLKRWGVDPDSFTEGRAQTRGMSPDEAEASIAKLAAAYKKGEPVEPVLETRDADNNITEVDGRSRALAAQRAGVDRIPIVVRRIGAEAAPDAASSAPIARNRVDNAAAPRTIPKAEASNAETNLGSETKSEPVPGPRKPSSPTAPGAETKVRVPGEDRAYSARYQVRELSDVQPSHSGLNFNPNEKYALVNDRDYSNSLNQGKVVTNSAPGKFDPSYHITDNPDATNGPVVIDSDGHALGGNGRAMILQRVYKHNAEGAAAYKALLAKKAQNFGLDPAQIENMKEPVLVRELADSELDPGTKQQAITDFNKKGTAELTPAERAIADSRRISQNTLDHVAGRIEQEGADGTLAGVLRGQGGTKVLDRLIDDGVISPQERAAYANSSALTEAGAERIRKLMVARYFRDPAQIDSTPASIRNKIETLTAPLARVDGVAGWDLTPHMQSAIDLLEEARTHGTNNIDDLLGQRGFWGDSRYSPEAITLAKHLKDTGARALTTAARQYAQDMADAHRPMFAEQAVTPEQAFKDAFAEVKKGKKEVNAARERMLGTEEPTGLF